MKRTGSISSARPLQYGQQRRGSRRPPYKIHAPPDSNLYDHSNLLDEFADYLNLDLAARRFWVSPRDKLRQRPQSTGRKNNFPWRTFTANHGDELRVNYESGFQADGAPSEPLGGQDLGNCVPQMHAPVTSGPMLSLMTNSQVEMRLSESTGSGLRTAVVSDLSDIVCDWRTYGTPSKIDLADFRKTLAIPPPRGLESPTVGQPCAHGPTILTIPGYGGSGTSAMTGITPTAQAVDDKDIRGNVFLNFAAADTADDLAIRSTSNDHEVTDEIAPFLPAQPSMAECDRCSEVRIRRNPAFSNFRSDDKAGNPITMAADDDLKSTDGQHKVLPGAVDPVEMDNAVQRIEFGVDEPLTLLEGQSGRLSPALDSVGPFIYYSGNSMVGPVGTPPFANEAVQTLRGLSTALNDSPKTTSKPMLAGNQKSQMIPDPLDVLPGVCALGKINQGMFMDISNLECMDISNVDLKGQLARFLSGQNQRGSFTIRTGNTSTIPDVGACQPNAAAADSDPRTDTALTTARVLQSARAPILAPPMDDFQNRDVLWITGVAKDCLQRVEDQKDTPSLTKNVAALPPTRRASHRTTRPASTIGGVAGMSEQELDVILQKRRERKAALREVGLNDEAVDQSEGHEKCRQNPMKKPRRVYGVKRAGTYTKDRSALEQAAQDGYLASRHHSTGEENIGCPRETQGGEIEKCEKMASTVSGRSA